jgi:CRISPR-associated endonuclease Cas2
MPPRKAPMGLPEKLRLLQDAGLRTEKFMQRPRREVRELPDLSERVAQIEQYFQNWQKIMTNGMLFFVMYDIEDNKVRLHLAKYLKRNGCTRMQKSVFLGNTSMKVYAEIAKTLAEINKMYQNGDSILILPISRESMIQLNVIGKDLDYKMAVSPPRVLII